MNIDDAKDLCHPLHPHHGRRARSRTSTRSCTPSSSTTRPRTSRRPRAAAAPRPLRHRALAARRVRRPALGDPRGRRRGRPRRRPLHDDGPPHAGLRGVRRGRATSARSSRRRARRSRATQTHWLRVADGQVIEHWANRDDLGTALQLGWVPPTPLYLARAALAKRKARACRRRRRLRQRRPGGPARP